MKILILVELRSFLISLLFSCCDKKHHGPGSLEKEAFDRGYSFRDLRLHDGWAKACWKEELSSHLDLQVGSREYSGIGANPQSPARQQHTSSNIATPSSPSQIGPPTGDPVVKCMSLWDLSHSVYLTIVSLITLHMSSITPRNWCRLMAHWNLLTPVQSIV